MAVDDKKQRWLILTSSTGSGHDIRAYALRDWAYREAGEAVQVDVWHVLEETSFVGRFGVQMYNWIQRHAPWLHQVFWQITEIWGFLIGMSMPRGGRLIRRRLREMRPHLIVSMHDALNRPYFAVARSELGRDNVRCVTYCGEWSAGFGFSRHWVDETVDLFVARSLSVRREAERRGVPPGRCEVFRNLLRPQDCGAGPDRAEERKYRRELGLDPELFTVLLASGALGADRHRRMLSALLPLADRVQAIVLCGRNKKAYRRVERWALENPQLRISLRGFEDRMRPLFAASDCVVTRGGSNMLAECIHYHRPVLFHAEGGMMPQEYCTRRFIERCGIGYFLRKPRQLKQAVLRWLEDPDAFAAVRGRFHELRDTRSPDELVPLLQKLAAEAQSGRSAIT